MQPSPHQRIPACRVPTVPIRGPDSASAFSPADTCVTQQRQRQYFLHCCRQWRRFHRTARIPQLSKLFQLSLGNPSFSCLMMWLAKSLLRPSRNDKVVLSVRIINRRASRTVPPGYRRFHGSVRNLLVILGKLMNRVSRVDVDMEEITVFHRGDSLF